VTTASRLSNALQGRYAMKRELGSGGMATVYVAHDVRHDREVAVKVLHPDLGAMLGGERFLTEIKTTARLQHPHILPLLDSGEADGLLFYVMPLVEGQTLRQKLERERQLPIDDALRIAAEVAGALDYAHRHGVIHRDIKPENILLHDGRAVVADFGIALAVTAASGTRMTQTGLSLGTPQYMAPEQAMGEKVIDARADVYALGAVTYEMLTGEPPFSGATVQAIVAKVLTEKPMSLTAIRDSAPRHVELTVNKALAKLPADRFATAAQFADALAQPQLTAGLPGATTSRAATQPGWRHHLGATPAIWALVALTSLAAASGWLRGTNGSPPPAPLARFVFPPGPRISMAPVPTLAMSSDGSRIAFAAFDSSGRRFIFVRSLDRLDAVPVAGSLFGSSPFFSPSGDSIGFHQDDKLRVVPLNGGSVRTICDWRSAQGANATWGDDGTIVFSDNGSLYRVTASGGAPSLLAQSSARGRLVRPHFLPGSRALLAVEMGDSTSAVAIRLNDGSMTRLPNDIDYPQYVNDGLLVFGRADGTINAVGFDATTLTLTGEPELVMDKVLVAGTSISRFGVSRNGAIAHLWGAPVGRRLVVVDRTGTTTHTLPDERLYRYPRFSPAGRDLAYHIEVRGGVSGDIWRASLDGGGALRLTTDSISAQPEWDPDGQSLVYLHRGGLRRVTADGSSRETPVLKRPQMIYESHITPDRRTIVFREDVTAGNRDILMATLDSPSVVRPLLTSSFDEKGFALSPDGKWLAYVSNETGADEVYLRRLEENSARWVVSRGGGREARWARNEIFYRSGDSVMVASVTLANTPVIGTPRLLFTGSYASTAFEPLWDVSPDGNRFAFVKNPSIGGTQIGLLLNWTANWKARQPQR
jgi:serine/threonine protein kinase/Tol biopolymer transport system component